MNKFTIKKPLNRLLIDDFDLELEKCFTLFKHFTFIYIYTLFKRSSQRELYIIVHSNVLFNFYFSK